VYNLGMQIVIGTQALTNAAGTESYVCLVARQLQRLGHDVVVSAEELGPMADHAEGRGVVVARTAADLPQACDAILSNDTASAATLAARFPGTRLVHVAHSEVFDHQLPVLVPGVVDAIVVCSERTASHVRALSLDVPLVRLRLPVDMDHLLGTGPLPARPRRALIVSNYLKGERRRALVEAWEGQGVACTQIGVLTEAAFDPGPAMRDADVVVAKASAALEAMACERAVYVYDQFGGDGWITPDTYEAFEADNLAGLSSPAPRTPAQLAADLADYDPAMGWINGELARTHHAPGQHAQQLVDVLTGEHTGPPVPATVLSEIARLTRVAMAAERKAIGSQYELVALRERVIAAEEGVAQWRARAERAEQLLSTSRARAGIAAGRALDRLRGLR
jgi:hypothetical protein